MAKIDNSHVDDRITTIDDERKRVLDLYDMRIVPPGVGIFDEPTRCYTINKEWAKIVMGMVSWLTEIAPWYLAENEDYEGIQQVLKFLQGDNCSGGDCTIEELLADDEFFYDEYLPANLGTKYSNTETQNQDLADDYDGTPQSIGTEIPVGTPNDEEKNALCIALLRFVKLYSSEKICIIQSRSFGEVAWDALEDAAESFYGSTLDRMLGNWSDNLFGCIVDIPTALIALADTAAHETLACHLLDQLDGGAISESAFNTAIDNAAIGGVSGNAQKIACVMSEDMEQIVYLNFLEAYNTALLQSAAGDAGDCPCITASYRVWRWNFENGLGDFVIKWVSNIKNGTLNAGRVEGVVVGAAKTIQMTLALDPTWRIKGCRIRYSRGGTAAGQAVMRWRPIPDSNTGALNPSISGGSGLGDNIFACQNIVAPAYMDGMNELILVFGVNGITGAHYIYIHEIEILYYDSYSPAAYPTADADLCT